MREQGGLNTSPVCRHRRWFDAPAGPPVPQRLPWKSIVVASSGNPFHPLDRWRSITLTDCAPLGALDGIRWTSLQIGPRANEALEAGSWLEPCDRAIEDFADTAAIVAQLDLVIAVDTAVAHLAGALGVPVWLLLRPRPDWRWLRKGEYTPWYRSMRLLHARRRAWPEAIDEVASGLRALRA